jgi:squalene-hopene/tetraprenyl-beta-curcumene cyclase
LDFSRRLQNALAKARGELLAARTPEGHWVGELSSSALSTATAVCALAVVDRESRQASRIDHHAPCLEKGLDWLARHANPDGGWGDTILSLSNISTTTLCWAALGTVRGADGKYRAAARAAEKWLTERAGTLSPDKLAAAIIGRYGKDRTFSAPILAMCAISGRLGSGSDAWKDVLTLPFELAAVPPQFYAALRLPVVSYALPALIAIGQARHHHLPTRNPFTRLIRNLTRSRTLEVLKRIQPSSGGFLEATPLTSFVTMSLAASGQVEHPVTAKGIEFLVASQRGDGSWPIDTNLATWVTTLSVNALFAGRASGSPPVPDAPPESCSTSGLTESERERIADWLLKQQFREVHPYTRATPGGWAWTHLPGGVPDADDTAGALLALKQLSVAAVCERRTSVANPSAAVTARRYSDNPTHEAAIAGVTWLLNLQNRDGGIPTFCRGWTNLQFDRSSPDLAAHALRAWKTWLPDLPAKLQQRVREAIKKGLGYLARTQGHDSEWVPLWFGNQHSGNEENPIYGTARVLLALSEMDSGTTPGIDGMLLRGGRYLARMQREDGSWSGGPNGPPSVEETALAIEALAALLTKPNAAELTASLRKQAVKGANWLIEKVESGEWRQPSPIGFYFAKLWYCERLYPLSFTVGALGRAVRTLP